MWAPSSEWVFEMDRFGRFVWNPEMRPWVVGGAIVGIVALTVLAIAPFAPSADAFSVYLPVVFGFAQGEGLASFVHLESGLYRAPLYPVLLFVTSGLGASIPFGLRVLGWLSAVAVGASSAQLTRVLGATGRTIPFLAVIGLSTSPAFVIGLTSSTPDMLATALVLGAVVVALDARHRWPALCGMLLALGVLCRFNHVALVPGFLFLGATRRNKLWLAHFALGAAAPVLLWMGIGLALGRGPLWLPSGPTYLPPADLPVDLGASLPSILGGLALQLPRTALALVKAAGLPQVVFALVAFVAMRGARFERAFIVALVVLTLTPLALVHGEDRYFLLPACLLAVAAAKGVRMCCDRRPRWARAFVAASVSAFVVVGGLKLVRRLEQLRASAPIHEEALRLAERLGGVEAIAADRLAYTYTPLRLALQPRDVRCCEVDATTTAFVRIEMHAPNEAMPGFEIDPQAGPFFRVYRRVGAQ